MRKNTTNCVYTMTMSPGRVMKHLQSMLSDQNLKNTNHPGYDRHFQQLRLMEMDVDGNNYPLVGKGLICLENFGWS